MGSKGDSNANYGEPERWEFDFSWQLVSTGFWLWAMSDFRRLPTQSEVAAYDPRWISDLRLAHSIYAHQSNNEPVMRMFDEYMSFNESPSAYRIQQQYANASKKNQ